MQVATPNHHGGKAIYRLSIMASILLVALATAACVSLPQGPVTPTASESSAGPVECDAPAPATTVTSQEELSETVTLSTLAEGSPASAATAERATAAVWNMVGCWNSGEYASLVALWTPNLLQNQFGISDVESAPFILAGLPPLAIDSVGDVRTHTIDDDGDPSDEVVSVDVVYRREVGQHMLLHERWFFLPRGDWYLLHALQPLPVEVDAPATEVSATVSEHAIELDRATFTVDDALVFHVTNNGSQAHEFAVFRPPSATRAEEIIGAGELPEGSDIIGATFAFPGEQATDLVLVDLEPGTYVVVCNMETPDGDRHLPLGEVAEFTVQAP